MPFFHTKGIRIAGIACAVPDNYVTVESFSSVFGEEVPAKFSAGTGIKAMYKALPEQTASDLAFAAAENLFSHIEVERKKIGALIFVTQSPDYRRPASACVLQHRLRGDGCRTGVLRLYLWSSHCDESDAVIGYGVLSSSSG